MRAPLGAVLALAAAVMLACAPRARPLVGAPTDRVLPAAQLPPFPQFVRFTWRYDDESFDVKGDGVVRIAPPDRARLDLFVADGLGGGMAILEGDTLFVPGIDLIRRFLPPPPLLWGALGRLALPAGTDTVVRLDGDTLRADLVSAAPDLRTWRVHFAGARLVRIERIEEGRIVETVERMPVGGDTLRLRYVNHPGRRRLALVVDAQYPVQGFDDAIWQRP